MFEAEVLNLFFDEFAELAIGDGCGSFPEVCEELFWALCGAEWVVEYLL